MEMAISYYDARARNSISAGSESVKFLVSDNSQREVQCLADSMMLLVMLMTYEL